MTSSRNSLGGTLLAEQRDQTRLEDAKDYLATTSLLFEADTSIGLGQVVVSTARRNTLFKDLRSPATQSGLSHSDIAKHLASEEYNIFVVAQYVRQVADEGARKPSATLPRTSHQYPGINFAAYSWHSSTWPDDNIRALGSEYTSRAWDDSLRPAWGEFVFQAYQDMISTGLL